MQIFKIHKSKFAIDYDKSKDKWCLYILNGKRFLIFNNWEPLYYYHTYVDACIACQKFLDKERGNKDTIPYLEHPMGMLN